MSSGKNAPIVSTRSRRSTRVARSAVHAADALVATDLATAVAPPAEAIPPQDAQLLRELGIDESEEEEEDGEDQRFSPDLSQPVPSEPLEEEFSFGSQPNERPSSPPPSPPATRSVRPRSSSAIDVGGAARLMFGVLPGAQPISRPSTPPASATLSVADVCTRDFNGGNLNLLPNADVLLMKNVFSLQALRTMCARIPGFPKPESLSRVMLVKHVEAFRQIFDCAATGGSHRQPAAPASTVPHTQSVGAEGPVPPAMGDVPSRFEFREGSEPQASPSLIAAEAAVPDVTSLHSRPVLQPRGQFPAPPSSSATPGAGAPPAPNPAVDPRLAFFAGVHAPVSQPSAPQQHVQVVNFYPVVPPAPFCCEFLSH